MTVNKRISRPTAILAITSALVIACGGPAAVDSTSAPNTQIVRDPDNSSAKAFVAPALRHVSARSARTLRDPDNAAAASFVLPALREAGTGTVIAHVASGPQVIRDPDNPYWTLR